MKLQKRIITFLLLIVMVFLLPGCGSNETEAGVETGFNGEIFFAGSSTLAPTISQIADSFKNQYGTWDQVNESLPNEEIQISVSTGGSGAGAKAVLDKTANFGMLARHAKDTEKEDIEGYQEVRLGIDALLITVNRENQLGSLYSDLSTEEIRKIFCGEFGNWNEVDENLPKEEILLFVRDVGGGAHEVFQNSIMGEEDVSNTAIEVSSMPALVDRLIGNSQAIGYASYGITEANKENLTSFTINGIEPSEEKIISGDYPVSRPLILVWDGQLSIAEQAFLDYIQSEVGYEILSDMGFLPVGKD